MPYRLPAPNPLSKESAMTSRPKIHGGWMMAIGLSLAVPLAAVPPADDKAGQGTQSVVAPDEGLDPKSAQATFKLMPGMKIELYAAEPLLANPVALTLDEKGRIYVAETYRRDERGAPDNRRFMHWLDEDLASTSIDDRRRKYEKHLSPIQKQAFTTHSEIVRLVEDSDGDGKADKSTVFAEGFNDMIAGVGAGVLARQGTVYYTCIPSLYALRDTNGDGKADERHELSTGYGIKTALGGHDLHGLRLNPADGKLYFSLGDRSYNVATPDGRRLADFNAGAVFRCNLDGSNLEVFATGLRNPQELVFDQYGNLFTGENNCDAGDLARLVYVVEGGDCGWHMSFQYHPTRGPWMPERWWDLPFKEQAAFLNPPITHLTNGPSGFAYYPGTGMSDAFDHHFFLCDFKGTADRSGIHTFTLQPKGAGFTAAGVKELLWGCLATDCDFGPDGALYVSDWVHGWSGLGKGRIWKITDTTPIDDRAAAETRRLLAEGFGQTSSVHLIRFLSHKDMRVRTEAQLALAAKGEASTDAVTRVLDNTSNPLARLHSLWALGMIAPRHAEAMENLVNNLDNADPEIRGQAARIVGELKSVGAAPRVLRLLEDKNERVQYFAAMAIGRMGHRPALEPLMTLLARNADRDLQVRHAAVMGLAWLGDAPALIAAARHESRSVRMGALLALRRLKHAGTAEFLADSDPLIVVEAARAINDLPIPDATARLASLLGKPTRDLALLIRVINANFRLGAPEHAQALASLAADSSAPAAMRAEAVAALADWENPSPRDRVMNVWRPLPARAGDPARQAIQASLGKLLADQEPIAVAAAEAVAKLDMKDAALALYQLLARGDAVGAKVRIAAMQALGDLKDPKLGDVVKPALKDKNKEVRKAAQRLSILIGDNTLALDVLQDVLKNGTESEQQGAFAALAAMKKPEADAVLADYSTRLEGRTKRLPPEVVLDLELALEARAESPLIAQAVQRLKARQAGDLLGPYRSAMYGGDEDSGRKIFMEHTIAQCLRCHKVQGTGGDAGPDLTQVGSRGDRLHLLESLVNPQGKIAEGYGTIVVTLKNGSVVAGALRSEKDGKLTIINPEGKAVEVEAAQVAARTAPVSAMPPIGALLSKKELRDLVEYLSALK
jgi:quinoprotein glucose dehydrogenase